MVDAAYPRRPDGKTLFPFRRMFIIATKGTNVLPAANLEIPGPFG
jgi:hypothetical protein